MAGQLWVSREDADKRHFGQLADDAIARVEERLQLHISLLYSLRAFFEVAGTAISPQTFAEFVAGLELASRYNGIQGLGFAQTIATTHTDEAQRKLDARFGRPLTIWPQTRQPIRTPVMLLAPQDERNRAALGYDMYSDASRREAMQAAARSGRPVASAAVRLVQEIDRDVQFGFLVYLPMRADLSAGTGLVNDTSGFVYAPFRIGDFLNAALFEKPHLPVHAEVYDGPADADHLVYTLSQAGGPDSDRLAIWREIEVAGRTWRFHFVPTQDFQRFGSNYPAALLATFVLILALVLALLTLVQARRLEAVAALNRESQRNLDQKDLLLREMNHRIKNSITRMLSIARQTARRSEGLDDFTDRYEARLHAMSAAQEMLTRSKWGRAEIRALLENELKQVFGEEGTDLRLDGPAVEVDEIGAQSLGLTFHELATNAMKYGALSTPTGSLAVSWRLADGHVTIEWRESGGVVPDLSTIRSGFGTKLMDAMIRGELDGRIERLVENDAYVVHIRFPHANLAKRQVVPGSRL
ncbi:CHASE domain-containing protein [Jiella flava]|uniref:histidine kinase n=1 Tax=Jiella flava TaxID=2816857 RepID=A0A939FXX3_9HYPH|nr:CHASE domain-containing protein [Jiella flava]MBO0663540.1 CHASE domain-containing protein [Jiella flava]